MLSLLKRIFKPSPPTDFRALKQRGAVIVDVRSKGEYTSGHIKEAVNIPLPTLRDDMHRLSKEKPIITCCASGMRSGTARTILKSQGYEVYNGGSWGLLEGKLSR